MPIRLMWDVFLSQTSCTLQKGKSHCHLWRFLQQKPVFSCRVATDPSLSNIHCNNQNTTQSYFLNNIWLRRWMSHSQQKAGTPLSVCTQLGFSSQSHSTRHGVKIKLLYFSLHTNYLTWSLLAFNFKVKVKLQYYVHII